MVTLLVFVLLCAVAQETWAESVTFNVRSWNETSKQVVTTTDTKDCIVLTGNPGEWMQLGNVDNQDHYYVVKGSNVSYKTLNVFGRAHLILADDATLTCSGGIKVEKNNGNARLYIYSQSDGDHQGKLIVTNSYNGAAGIGSSEAQECGEIYIHGGNLDVTGGKWGAGIGSGGFESFMRQFQTAKDGKTTIYGGKVKAQGGELSAGIGGGTMADGGEYYQYGGEVTATGDELAAGVGGGGSYHDILPSTYGDTGGNEGKVYVYGGSLTATGGKRGAGIGSGNRSTIRDKSERGEVWIYAGATVIATGGKYGAGIGGGLKGTGIIVHICGGNVEAYGGEDAAGIGAGEHENGTGNANGGVVYISGGTVLAKGKSYGSGIGGGEESLGADVYITGGTVTAIAGEDCECRQWKNGSAIGMGDKSSRVSFEYPKDHDKMGGKLEIAANMRVKGGDAEDNIERVFTTTERNAACRWRNYVKIEECDHTTPTEGNDNTAAVTYTIGNDTHTKHCRYCADTHQEAHTYVENVCAYCYKAKTTSDDLLSVTLYRASAVGSTSYADRVVMKVVNGQPFTVPAVSATEGLTLMGYTTSWSEGGGIEMKDNDMLTAVGAVVTPTSDMSYYPRYHYRYVPTWTWDDATGTAKLTITCSALSSEAVNVSNIEYTTAGEVKTATATYNHGGATYTFTDTYLLPVADDVLLRDHVSNEETLDTYRGRKVEMLMLSGRTLFEDGSWNTLCLPFSLGAEDIYTYLGSCTLKTLGSSSFDSEKGELTLNFISATTIEAGKPYLIKWTSGSNMNNPMFNYVTISDAYEPVTTDYVDFCGFFSPVSLTANDKTVLFLGADNTLYWPSADMTVNACRAVFRLHNGITAGDLPTQASRFVLNFGEDEATGIINYPSSIFNYQNDAWYTLDGRCVANGQLKMDNGQLPRGIYIHNGKKVVIK